MPAGNYCDPKSQAKHWICINLTLSLTPILNQTCLQLRLLKGATDRAATSVSADWTTFLFYQDWCSACIWFCCLLPHGLMQESQQTYKTFSWQAPSLDHLGNNHWETATHLVAADFVRFGIIFLPWNYRFIFFYQIYVTLLRYCGWWALIFCCLAWQLYKLLMLS